MNTKTTPLTAEQIAKMNLREFILYVDSLTTKEFCIWQRVSEPYFTGNAESTINLMLQVDAIKHRLFVSKAKSIPKEANDIH